MIKNQKVIVLNSFSRGGSNIVWNILQSHPMICSPMVETGDIFYLKDHPSKYRQLFSQIVGSTLRSNIILRYPFFEASRFIIDKRFYKFKLKNFTNPDNRFKYEDIPYTLDEVKNSILCVKSLDQDIYLTELFSRIFQDCCFVGLVRNGYALCESWTRRGYKPEDAGYFYRKYGEKMLEDSKKYSNYTIIRFEDVLKNPFDKASELYEFAKLEITSLKKIRLKAKRTMSKEREHKVSYGVMGKKYWFCSEDIDQILKKDISDVQAGLISPADRKAFEKEAKPILEYFNYA